MAAAQKPPLGFVDSLVYVLGGFGRRAIRYTFTKNAFLESFSGLVFGGGFGG